MTTRVFGWSDGGSACEYYRIRVPLLHMAAMDSGVQIQISGKLGTFDSQHPITGSTIRHAPDIVVGQRVNRNGPAKMWEMLASGELGTRPRLVYELDDDLFNVPASNPAWTHFSRVNVQANIRRCMQLADVVTVSTESLAGVVQRQLADREIPAPPIVVIPNALPDIAYVHNSLPLEQPTRPDSGGLITIGWAGSSSHVGDFDEVNGALGRFIKRNPDTRFLALGHLFPRTAAAVPSDQTQLVRWTASMQRYYQALDRFDIGIIPLRPSVFNQSKSDIKFLEYAARCIPVIASDCGPYAEHVDADRASGANTAHWWQTHLADHADYIRSFGGPDPIVNDAYDYARTRGVESTATLWREAVLG